MLTQCPNCQTTFRVTSEVLRVAEGQVRCGRCQTQFNALERLIDENDAGETQSGRFLRPSRTSPPAEQIDVEEPAEHEDITLAGRHIEITGTYRNLDDAIGQPQLREESSEEWIEIEDPEQQAPSEGEIEVIETFEAEDAEQVQDEDALAMEDRTDDLESASLAESASEVDLYPRRERRATAPVWKWLAAPLVVLLVIQAVHHYRAALARHPGIGASLVGVYTALGLSLTPDWNLHAYEIRQWGVVSDPATPGTLRVRASITNLANFAQPYPLLKLVLEDRWGDQVRARAFEPAEYLDPGVAPERLLAPSQKANATINIVDPGPDAEGFRFDVCLPGKQGVVCAEETPRR
jgi:predicted Zn finger-like uncharacterized protein